MGRYRDMFDLTGRVALVAGAASGLGRASVLALANFGAFVVAADRDAAVVEALVGELEAGGTQGQAVGLDIRDRDQVRRTIAGIVECHGRLHVAVTMPSVSIRNERNPRRSSAPSRPRRPCTGTSPAAP